MPDYRQRRSVTAKRRSEAANERKPPSEVPVISLSANEVEQRSFGQLLPSERGRSMEDFDKLNYKTGNGTGRSNSGVRGGCERE